MTTDPVRIPGHPTPARPPLAIAPDSRPDRGGVDDDTGRRVRGLLSDAVGALRVARLLGGRTAIRCAADGVEVCVPDRFSAERVERGLGEALRRAVGEAVPGRGVRVRVEPGLAGAPEEGERAAPGRGAGVSDGAGEGGAAPARRARPAGRAQQGRGTGVPEYVVGGPNRMAFEAVRRAACEADGPGLVFVHGPCGVGKTHLLRYGAALCRRHRREARIRVTTGEQFVSGFVQAVQNNAMAEFQRRHRRLDLLVIDDVHVVAGKGGTQQELIRTLNDLQLTGARVVLGSDAHPRDIAKLQAALSSRLNAGVVAHVGLPDEDLARRLVPALCKRRGISLDPAAQELLIQRVLEDGTATPRDIEGTLTQIQAMSNLLDRDRALFLSAEHVRRAVEARAGERGGIRPGPVGIERIIDAVCQELAVTRDDLGGKGRARKVVLARELIVHLGKRHTGRSYPELATAIGRPNHSTVITAFNRFQGRLKAGERIDVGASVDGATAGELVGRVERAMGLGLR